MTPYSGVCVLTNPASIRAYNELALGERTASEISRATDIPLTSVHTALRRLEEDGVVWGSRDLNDRRSVRYRRSALTLIKDRNDKPWRFVESIPALDRPAEFPERFTETLLLLFTRKAAENGINVWPTLVEMGVSLNEFLRMPEAETMIRNRRTGMIHAVPHTSDLKVYVSFEDDLTVEAHSTGEHLSDSASLILAVVMGALSVKIPPVSGRNYSQVVKLYDKVNGDRVLRSGVYTGRSFETVVTDVRRRTKENYTCDKPFAVYSINGRAVLVTNYLMIRILTILNSHPKQAPELERSLSVSRVTLFSVLNKLIGMGAVTVDDTVGARNRSYVLNARLIIGVRTPVNNGFEKTLRYMRLTSDRIGDLNETILTYIGEMADNMGVDIDHVIGAVATDLVGAMRRDCARTGQSLMDYYIGVRRDVMRFHESWSGEPYMDTYALPRRIMLAMFSEIVAETTSV